MSLPQLIPLNGKDDFGTKKRPFADHFTPNSRLYDQSLLLTTSLTTLYNLYLTKEMKKYCKIAAHNRCQKCQKMDSTGHFLLCTKSNSQKIYGKFLEHCRETDPNLTAEKLIHMDNNGKSEEIYAIGWVLATLTEAHFSKKICKNLNEALSLKITLTSNITTFKFLNKEKYAITLKLIESLINT